MDALQIVPAGRIELFGVGGLQQQPAEAFDAAQRRAQVVGQGGAERVELARGGLELQRAVEQTLFQLGVARVQRLLATFTQTASRFGRDLESADLRYPNGYAIKLRGVTTLPVDTKEKK